MVRRHQRMVAWFEAEQDSSRCTVRRPCAASQARLQMEAYLGLCWEKHIRTQECWDSVRQTSS